MNFEPEFSGRRKYEENLRTTMTKLQKISNFCESKYDLDFDSELDKFKGTIRHKEDVEAFDQGAAPFSFEHRILRKVKLKENTFVKAHILCSHLQFPVKFLCLDQKASLMILIGFNYIPTTIKFDMEFKNVNSFFIYPKKGIRDIEMIGCMIVALQKIDSQMGFAFEKKKALQSVNNRITNRIQNLAPLDITLPSFPDQISGGLNQKSTEQSMSLQQ